MQSAHLWCHQWQVGNTRCVHNAAFLCIRKSPFGSIWSILSPPTPNIQRDKLLLCEARSIKELLPTFVAGYRGVSLVVFRFLHIKALDTNTTSWGMSASSAHHLCDFMDVSSHGFFSRFLNLRVEEVCFLNSFPIPSGLTTSMAPMALLKHKGLGRPLPELERNRSRPDWCMTYICPVDLTNLSHTRKFCCLQHEKIKWVQVHTYSMDREANWMYLPLSDCHWFNFFSWSWNISMKIDCKTTNLLYFLTLPRNTWKGYKHL